MKNFLFFIFFPLFSTAQSTQTKQLIDYRKQLLPEKIYVHTDKNIYAAGETIWFALYAVDGQTHLPGAFSQLIRVALVDCAVLKSGKKIKNRKFFMLDWFNQ